ncbi:MAG: hypothetical protein ACOZNI_35975 [Myxococcota bacterium]
MRRLPHFSLVALALVLTAHVWAAPAIRMVGRAEGEFRDHLWVAWLVQRRVIDDGALPLFFPLAGFPDGIALYPLDPLNQAFLLVLAPIVGLLPAMAALATALLWLAGYGGLRLAAACGAGPVASAIAGALTMLGPPVLGPYVDGQTEAWGVGWLALLLAELADPGPWDRRRGLRLGLWGAALAASCPYQAHGIALLAVPLAIWRARRAVLWAAIPAALVGAGLAAALWHAEAGGQLESRADKAGDWPPRTVIRGIEVAPPLDMLTEGFPTSIGAYERNARRAPPTTGPRRDVGWALPALVLAAAALDRRARWLAGGALLYASIAVGSARDWDAYTALSGARIPLPYDLFYRWFPLGDLAWKPQAYAVPAWVLGVAAVARLPARWLVPAAFAVVVELQAVGPTPAPLPAVELAPRPLHAALAAGEGGVVEFPCRARSRKGVDALPADVYLHQVHHGRPIGETFGRRRNKVHQRLLDALAGTLGWPGKDAPALGPAWSLAAKAGYTTLLVHTRALWPDEVRALREVLPGTCEEVDGALVCEIRE